MAPRSRRARRRNAGSSRQGPNAGNGNDANANASANQGPPPSLANNGTEHGPSMQNAQGTQHFGNAQFFSFPVNYLVPGELDGIAFEILPTVGVLCTCATNYTV